MNRFFIVTAALEAAAGIALLFFPSETVTLILAYTLRSSTALGAAQAGGVVLFVLGLANWLAHYKEKSISAQIVLKVMLFYNIGIALFLGALTIRTGSAGPLLCPAILLHISMSIWCISCLKKEKKQAEF